MTQLYGWVLTDFMAMYKPKWMSTTRILEPPLLEAFHNEYLEWLGKCVVELYSSFFKICSADPRALTITTVLAGTSQISKELFLQHKLIWQGLWPVFVQLQNALRVQVKNTFYLLSYGHTHVWMTPLCPLISFTESWWVTVILFDMLGNIARPERWLCRE